MEFIKDIDNECGLHIKSEVCSSDHIFDKLQGLVVNSAIKSGRNNPLPINEKKNIIKLLKQKHPECNSESCLLQINGIKNHVGAAIVDENLKENFKPIGPRTTSEWLSNFDIDDILDQIEKKYKDKYFLHIPFQMRDFATYNTPLEQLNFYDKYKEGYKTFGVILNTGLSSSNGIHWVGMFGDFRQEPFTIEFFNSSGEPPKTEFTVWMHKKKLEWGKLFGPNKRIEIVVASKFQHQYDNHSCGVYSLYYIISRLDGITAKYFMSNKITDDEMHEFRKYLFRDK